MSAAGCAGLVPRVSRDPPTRVPELEAIGRLLGARYGYWTGDIDP